MNYGFHSIMPVASVPEVHRSRRGKQPPKTPTAGEGNARDKTL